MTCIVGAIMETSDAPNLCNRFEYVIKRCHFCMSSPGVRCFPITFLAFLLKDLIHRSNGSIDTFVHSKFLSLLKTKLTIPTYTDNALLTTALLLEPQKVLPKAPGMCGTLSTASKLDASSILWSPFSWISP